MNKPIDTIEETYRGHKITVKWFYDEDMGPPWKEHSDHGPVSECTRRDKRPGEWVLWEDRGSKLYYNAAEAMKIAKRDGWDAPPYKTGTKGQQAERAVKADFELLRRFCKDDWCWVGYVMEIPDFEHGDSCWGFESDYMNECTKEVIQDAKNYIDRETEEAQWAANHEIETVR